MHSPASSDAAKLITEPGRLGFDRNNEVSPPLIAVNLVALNRGPRVRAMGEAIRTWRASGRAGEISRLSRAYCGQTIPMKGVSLSPTVCPTFSQSLNRVEEKLSPSHRH
jgi:hypothetical protein